MRTLSLTNYCMLLSALLLPFQALVFAQNPSKSQKVSLQPPKASAPTFGQPKTAFIPLSNDQKLAKLVKDRKTMSLDDFEKQVKCLAHTGSGFTSKGINQALAVAWTAQPKHSSCQSLFSAVSGKRHLQRLFWHTRHGTISWTRQP